MVFREYEEEEGAKGKEDRGTGVAKVKVAQVQQGLSESQVKRILAARGAAGLHQIQLIYLFISYFGK